MKLYWHFTSVDRKLSHRDGRKIIKGRTLRVTGEPVLCVHGLHACEHIINALDYAEGPIVSRVKLGGKVLHDKDKSVATERTVVAIADATDVLRKFARMCALDVSHLWDAPPVVVEYLKTGDKSLRAAAKEASLHTLNYNTVWFAALDDPCIAARGAARGVAQIASHRAGLAAAWIVGQRFGRAIEQAQNAAWTAERNEQKKRLTRMMLRLLRT